MKGEPENPKALVSPSHPTQNFVQHGNSRMQLHEMKKMGGSSQKRARMRKKIFKEKKENNASQREMVGQTCTLGCSPKTALAMTFGEII